MGLVLVAHGLSCSAACGIVSNQGSNPCPLHSQVASHPQYHQGSPPRISHFFFTALARASITLLRKSDRWHAYQVYNFKRNAFQVSTFMITSVVSLFYRYFLLVQFSRSIVSNSLQPHGLQHARLPCPSPTPRAYSNSCPSSQ